MKPKTRMWFETIGPSLARQVRAGIDSAGQPFQQVGRTIYARVRNRGRLTWKSTQTHMAKDARKWLTKWRRDAWALRNGFEPEGVVLQRGRVSVAELAEEYVAAGFPRRKNGRKSPRTIWNEQRSLRPILAYFGNLPAASLSARDCDKYREWRANGQYVATYKLRGHAKTMRTKGGNRAVDLELWALSNALAFAVRRNVLTTNPLAQRPTYVCADEIRHCREVAPSPEGLRTIIATLRARHEHTVADVLAFLAYSGLRIGEALPLQWPAVNLGEGLVNVHREKKGCNPWVALSPELEALLRDMQPRAVSSFLFASPHEPTKPRDASAIRHRLTAVCRKLKLGHVTPHGLRSYFVTQARQSGLTDAEIAALIGDKSGPALIASTYGDLRPDHLLAQARRIRHAVAGDGAHSTPNASHNASHMSPLDKAGTRRFPSSRPDAETAEASMDTVSARNQAETI